MASLVIAVCLALLVSVVQVAFQVRLGSAEHQELAASQDIPVLAALLGYLAPLVYREPAAYLEFPDSPVIRVRPEQVALQGSLDTLELAEHPAPVASLGRAE